MKLSLKLENFEGPLDLLLHLIDKNKVSIYDIPIVVITDQYLEYIENITEDKMEVMSSFIEMAAILLGIKAKMLLPKHNDIDEDEDPRAALIERLLEYKKYKLISKTLKVKYEKADRMVFKESSIPKEVKNYFQKPDTMALLEDIEFAKLYKIFQSIVKRNIEKIDVIKSEFGDIKKEVYTLQGKVEDLLLMREEYKVISFSDLFSEVTVKSEMVITFLAVLELIKMGNIRVEQMGTFDDIIIRFIR